MIQTQFTKPMRHPLHPDQPMEKAEIVDDWLGEKGDKIGLVLEFADEHIASLTTAEIKELQAVEVTA